jgi:REP element-mobilizing transposase RayT
MAQTLVSLLIHIVFSTKNRARFIKPEIEPELYPYMSQVASNQGSRCLAINGTEDHVHLLVSHSKTLALSALLKEVKQSSSKWIKTKGAAYRAFEWQEGYGAFSIGQSGVAGLREYIAQQKQKHKGRSFESELLALLKKYGIEYDERYLWR